MAQHPMVGDVVTLKGKFKPGDGTPDPSGTITVRVCDPFGNVTSFPAFGAQGSTMARVANTDTDSGTFPWVYKQDWVPTVPGDHTQLWKAYPGDGQSVDDEVIKVYPVPF